MAKLIWAVLCRRAIIDQQTKQASLIDVIEKITLYREELEGQLPDGRTYEEVVAAGIVFPMSICLVQFWTRSAPNKPEDFEMRILTLSPSGRELNKNDLEISLAKYRNSRPAIQILNMVYVEDGIYRMVIQKRDAGSRRFMRQAEIPLEIILAEGAAPVGPPL